MPAKQSAWSVAGNGHNSCLYKHLLTSAPSQHRRDRKQPEQSFTGEETLGLWPVEVEGAQRMKAGAWLCRWSDEPKRTPSDGWMWSCGVGGGPSLGAHSFSLPLLPAEDAGMGAESPMGRARPAHSPALLHKEVCLLMGLPQFFPQGGHSPSPVAETGPTESTLPPASPEAESGAAASQDRCLTVPKAVMGWLDEMGLKSSWAELLWLLPK